MKKKIIFYTAALMVLPVFSGTNEQNRTEGKLNVEHRGDDGGRRNREGRRRERTPEEKEKMQERRLQMMEKTLKELGITEEQKLQISELQTQMKEQMRENYRNMQELKKSLKELEDSGAPETEIFAAIDAVAEAQAEQMKILARNRIQMERILGKEKFNQFMDKARNKWKEHGRRPGQNLPPTPPSIDRGASPAPPLPTS